MLLLERRLWVIVVGIGDGVGIVNKRSEGERTGETHFSGLKKPTV